MASRARRTRGRVAADVLRLATDPSSPLHDADITDITWSMAGRDGVWIDLETADGLRVEIQVTVTDPGTGSDGE